MIPAICCERFSRSPTAPATTSMVWSMWVMPARVWLMSPEMFLVNTSVLRASCSTSSACWDISVTECASAVTPLAISSVAVCCEVARSATAWVVSPR
ncbi:hypothetical protein D3C87_1461730 [compost metagenome]